MMADQESIIVERQLNIVLEEVRMKVKRERVHQGPARFRRKHPQARPLYSPVASRLGVGDELVAPTIFHSGNK